MAGLTPNGFTRKRMVDIKLEIETALKAIWGKNTNFEESSRMGQLIGILTEAFADQWESQEHVYNSQYPATASGTQLGNVVTLNGIIPLSKVKSRVSAWFTGLEGTPVVVGTGAKTSLGAEFKVITEVTIPAGGGVFADMEAEEYGPVVAGADTLTIITSPTYGLMGVTNPTAAVVGRNDETDAELRERREEIIGGLGKNNTDSLFGQLWELNGVSGVAVINNGTDAEKEGIPPHQFESIVEGGLEADIAAVIWKNTPQGIMSYGDILTEITDDQGFPQEIRYTRPGAVNIYATIDIRVDPLVFPVGGDALIKNDFVAYGSDSFDIGDDVVQVQFYGPVTKTPGILGATVKIGFGPGAAGAGVIVIQPQDKSHFDVAFVEVNFV